MHLIDSISSEEMDFDMRIARYEYLIDRRPLLLSSVMLRQNPVRIGRGCCVVVCCLPCFCVPCSTMSLNG